MNSTLLIKSSSSSNVPVLFLPYYVPRASRLSHVSEVTVNAIVLIPACYS